MHSTRIGPVFAAVVVLVALTFTAAPGASAASVVGASVFSTSSHSYPCTSTKYETNGNSTYKITQNWVVFGKEHHLAKPTTLKVAANTKRSRSLRGEYFVDDVVEEMVYTSTKKLRVRTMTRTFTNGIARGERRVAVTIILRGGNVLRADMYPCK